MDGYGVKNLGIRNYIRILPGIALNLLKTGTAAFIRILAFIALCTIIFSILKI